MRFFLIFLLFLSYDLFAKEGESHFGIDGGYTYYANLGGVSDADAGFLYYGFRF